MTKRVLIACEFSGIVRRAFRALGHDAWSCDIEPSLDSSSHHIQGDVLDILDDNWDMMIAHPPCTYLSTAGAGALYMIPGKLNPRRYQLGLDAREFFMRLHSANIPQIAIENPTPLTVYNLPRYTQVIQPYQHGEPFSKRTCLWLKNLPKIKPTNIVDSWDNTTTPGNWYNKTSHTGLIRQQGRSLTFPGIANAFALQWG